MFDFDKALESLDKKSQSLEDSINRDEKLIEEANKQIEDAKDRQVLARDDRAKIAVARDHIEEAKKAMADVSNNTLDTAGEKDNDSNLDASSRNNDSDSVDNDENTSDNVPVVVYDSEESKEQKSNTGRKVATAIGVIVLLGALAAGGYALIKEARSGKIKDDNNDDLTKSMSDTLLEDENEETKEDQISILFGEEDYEPLTTENMENLVSEYANKYSEEYDGIIETKDIVKFAAIANIDVLAEDNKELANELFGNQPKEEYLNDAAKLIGATVMYNYKQWSSSLSTKDFIRVSDLIYGEQKDKMLEIEDYTDRIAGAVNMNDNELVNKIVSEFIEDLNSGKLSKLDDGVGFAAQVNIAMIADVIARNHLNQENFDMFQILKTSEKYVSNIFRVYEECNNTETDVKTLTKTN